MSKGPGLRTAGEGGGGDEGSGLETGKDEGARQREASPTGPGGLGL